MRKNDSGTSPLVSIVMPVYNYENYIARAIESIINQTYKNLEIVIVDDHSTDGSWKIIKEYAAKDMRIKPIRNTENLRLTKTLNVSAKAAKGKYLARMDGDDERVLDSIEKQVAFLEENPDVVIVGGAAEVCDDNMKRLNNRFYAVDDTSIRQKMFRYSPFCHASIVMRAGILGDEPYQIDWAEDYDLYFRLGRVGKFANLDDVLYRIRTHPRSISQAKQRQQEKMTFYVRLKAVAEYGYKMKTSDKFYFAAQLATMYLMPPRFRFWLFNKIRARS